MNTTATKNRLPGVYFQVEPQRTPDALPRMDVAAFVGFASSGPLHTPVLIEDLGRFRDLFGVDLPLAWEVSSARTSYAHLGSAVEAFFRNGGRRCWVVRVAGDGAGTNRFMLPGLVELTPASSSDGLPSLRPAVARARSEGSWSDDLRVGTVRLSQTVQPLNGNAQVGNYWIDLAAGPGQLSAGQLLQLTFGEEGPLLFIVIEGVATISHGQRITSTRGQWFAQRLEVETFTALSAHVLSPLGPDEDYSLELALPSPPIDLVPVCYPDEGSLRIEVRLAMDLETAPSPGDLVRVRFKTAAGADAELLLPVETVEHEVSTGLVVISGSEGLFPMSEADGEAALAAMMEDENDGPSSGNGSSQSPDEGGDHGPEVIGELISFQAWIWQDQETKGMMDRLAFDETHPRFWGALPDDKTLFALSQEPRESTTPDPLVLEATTPRFALAGPETPTSLYLPLGMARVADLARTEGALDRETGKNTLSFDGLEAFNADLFLDPDLAGLGVGSLLEAAHHKYYLREDHPLPRGLYSLLPLEEVSMVAIPDAVHRGWEETQTGWIQILEAPELLAIDPADSEGRYTVRWKPIDGAAYLLQESADPGFSRAVTRYSGEEYEAEIEVESTSPRTLYYRVRATLEDLTSAWSNTQAITEPTFDFNTCSVQRLGTPEMQPIGGMGGVYWLNWSWVQYADGYLVEQATDAGFLTATTLLEANTTWHELQKPEESLTYYRVRAWRTHTTEPVMLSLIERTVDDETEQTLLWPEIDGALQYRLEGATNSAFSDARELYTGTDTHYTPDVTLLASLAYFRVTAQVREYSPWSSTRPIIITSTVFAVRETDRYARGDLLAVHRALVRFCAARADMLALLSLPSHYREDDALVYVAALTPNEADDSREDDDGRYDQNYDGIDDDLPTGDISVPVLSEGETHTLSYGVLYHPWVYTRTEEGRPTAGYFLAPPEGTVCGAMAHRTLESGAWIAPANDPLKGVVALEPAISRDGWAKLFAAQVNVLRKDPRGFLLLSAWTLSEDTDLKPLNVRRLMILLRRLAWREGMTYVFQPNDERFRRFVRHRFEQLLGDMYTRGAFAGAEPEEAFQVVVDESINPPTSVDAGKIIIELRVAPARPLAFLTVKLVQAGNEGLAIQER